MPAGYIDLYLDQNATYNTSVTLIDVNGNPINLSNYLVSSNIKTSYITANVTSPFTVTTLNTAGGVIALSLDYTTTANLSPRIRYVYDIMIRNTVTNVASRVLEGTIFVTPGTTLSP